MLVRLRACAGPTITGAELYAHVETLRATGRATIGAVAIRKEDVLSTGAGGQAFLVEQVIATCHGGDPAVDVDCTLALLLDQRFTVTDHVPVSTVPKPPTRDDESSSIIASVVVVGLAVGAIGGLVYGAATCEFEGCKYVFGVPIVLVAAGSLFLLGRD